MMDWRQRQELDRYITGNYGEDQFKGLSEDVAYICTNPDDCEHKDTMCVVDEVYCSQCDTECTFCKVEEL